MGGINTIERLSNDLNSYSYENLYRMIKLSEGFSRNEISQQLADQIL